jgi:protein-disulfide isomerase
MSSRARTRERRQEREKQRTRNRQLVLVGVVAAVAVILVVFLVLSNLPTEATISPETVERYAGIPQSVDEEGFPVLGNPDAPIKVVEYASFDCPHCGEFYQTITPSLVERARNGEISMTYVPLYGTGGIRNGEGAARAAICAGAQGDFWTYHGTLFSWQNTYVNQAFDGNRLESGATNLGLDVGAWNSCLRSEETSALLVAATTASTRLEGFTGTPTVTVDGTIITPELNAINQAIDTGLSMLSQLPEPIAEVTEEATEEATEAASEATEEATEEAAD